MKVVTIFAVTVKKFTIVPKLSVPRLSVSIFVVTELTYYRPEGADREGPGGAWANI